MPETTPPERKRDYTGLLLAAGLLVMAVGGGVLKLATRRAPPGVPAPAPAARPDLASGADVTARDLSDPDDDDKTGDIDEIKAPDEPLPSAPPAPAPPPSIQPAAKTAKPPPRRPTPPLVAPTGSGFQVRGSLDKEIVRRIVQRHINEARFCYERGLARKPDLAGRVTIQFTIAGSGNVAASIVQSSTLKDPQVEQCLAAAARRWTFPQPPGGGIVIVSYPFTFASAI